MNWRNIHIQSPYVKSRDSTISKENSSTKKSVRYCPKRKQNAPSDQSKTRRLSCSFYESGSQYDIPNRNAKTFTELIISLQAILTNTMRQFRSFCKQIGSQMQKINHQYHNLLEAFTNINLPSDYLEDMPSPIKSNQMISLTFLQFSSDKKKPPQPEQLTEPSRLQSKCKKVTRSNSLQDEEITKSNHKKHHVRVPSEIGKGHNVRNKVLNDSFAEMNDCIEAMKGMLAGTVS